MRQRPNYGLKSKVLNEYEKWLKLAKKAKLKDYLTNKKLAEINYDGIVGFNPSENIDNLYIEAMFNGLTPAEFEEVMRINEASYKRSERLKTRITKIITENESLFLTLTFNDDTLNSTTEKERRVAVTRYLKQYNCQYVANIDYGAQNHREHYHAVIGCKHVDNEKWQKKYGAIKFERIRLKNNEEDITKISKYIAKLSNHAIKETTKRSALIYSR